MAISVDPRGGHEPRLSAQIPQQQGRRGKNGEIPAQGLGAEQHSPAQEARLLSRWGGRGLGAEAPALVLAGRESGKKSAADEEARDFSLPLCFAVRKERGFRAPPKQAPETGASHGYQRGTQRRAGDATAAAAATKKPVCEHRSLSTLPLPGACAARHGQGPMIP